MVVLPGRRPAAPAPELPVRGPGVRRAGLVLPPTRMPIWRRGSMLKRWRYVGIFAPELLLCVGRAHVGPVPRVWWAAARPGGELVEGRARAEVGMEASSVRVEAPDAQIRLDLGAGAAVETASPAGPRGNYIWTSKRAGIPVSGTAVIDGLSHAIEGPYGFVDDSAGYHARHTTWRWCAGIGRAEDGHRVAWNLVSGVHDAPQASERTLWVEGEPREVAPVTFAPNLSKVSFAEGGSLLFDEWAAREEETNLLVLRSSYRQPFGAFSGELPGGTRLREGFGVMEYHDVHW